MKNYFVSWSGGKDSCLALYRAIKKYGKPKCLVTQLTEEGDRSRSHGLKNELLQKQANSLGIEIQFNHTSWNDYEATFVRTLTQLKNQDVELGIFGDLNIVSELYPNNNREWADSVCQRVGIDAEEPLWDDNPADLIQEFFDAGFIAIIISVNADKLNPNYLGKTLTPSLIKEFKDLGIDPLGENGEYHTVVIDGPIFNKAISVAQKERSLRDGYYFLDVDVRKKTIAR